MSLCLSHYLSLSLFFLVHTYMYATDPLGQCCMFPALSGTLQIMLNSVDLTKALMNGVLLAFYFSLPFKSAESFPVVHLVEKERAEKWRRRVREKNGWVKEGGEREIFLFISGCKERTSREVRGFKGSMFAVQGSDSSRGEKCGLHGIYETFQTCTFKALCDPVHTCTQDSSRLCAHTYRKLCDVIDLPIYQFLFCQSRPPSLSCLKLCSFFFFFNRQKLEWIG